MMTFELMDLTETEQADFKADGRMRAYLALKGAFKKRAKESGVTIQSLSRAVGRDKAQISRIISGQSKGITLDTLVLLVSALGYRISFDAKPIEEMAKRNRSAAPHEPVRTRPLDLVVPTALFFGGGTSTANSASPSFSRPVDARVVR